MIKTIKKIIASIQTVDDYLVEKQARGRDQDRRIDKIFLATLNGEGGWFLELIRRDPTCALKVIKECDLDDKSTK